MELLCIERMEDLDFPKLMEIYRAGNLIAVPRVFPDEKDLEAGLRRLEEMFFAFYRDEFFRGPGNLCCVLTDGDLWASTVRLIPVPGRRNTWYAEALATKAELLRRGYASALYRELFLRLAQNGDFLLLGSVKRGNSASLALHRRCGFEICPPPAVSPLNGTVNPNAFGLRYRGAGRS